MTPEEQFEQTLNLFIPATENLDDIQLNTAELLELFKAEIQKAEEKEKALQLESEETLLSEVETDPLELSENEFPPNEIIDEEPEEPPVDYAQLMYEEMLNQNEQITLISETLVEMQAQNEITNHADHLTSIYGLIIIPALLIIYGLNKMIRPFTSYSSY